MTCKRLDAPELAVSEARPGCVQERTGAVVCENTFIPLMRSEETHRKDMRRTPPIDASARRRNMAETCFPRRPVLSEKCMLRTKTYRIRSCF